MPSKLDRLLLGTIITLKLTDSYSEWHGNIKLVSDYIYRGYSKSRGNPVAQAQIEYQSLQNGYAGIQVSQVRFDDQSSNARAEMEMRPYLGTLVPLSQDFSTELSARGYVFDNKIFNKTADYAELFTALHYKDWLSASVAFAPYAYQHQANITTYEIHFRHDLLDSLQFSTGLGYSLAAALLERDYFYWNAGLSWFASSFLSVDLRYVDTTLKLPKREEDEHDEFYPRPQEHQYLFSMTLGF